MITTNTPIEEYMIEGRTVYVKREDLACSKPGPPFAKVRGLYPILLQLKQQGINTVGYVETSISMAGWGISYFCDMLNMKAVIFTPQYKDGYRHNQELQNSKWNMFGAEIIPLIKPTQMKINYYRSVRQLKEKYPDAKMLPIGLPFKETVENVSDEILNINSKLLKGSIVSCVGSGTMSAGIIKGCSKLGIKSDFYGILVSKKSVDKMRTNIISMSGVSDICLKFDSVPLSIKLNIIDYDYEYTTTEDIETPFPCNPYYDKKAWKWLLDNIDKLKDPILFWNIGA